MGAFFLLLGTYLHPQDTDPNDAVAAFTEYAADHLWVASHLMQLAGLALMVAARLCLARTLESGRGAAWARLAAGGAIASLAVAAALAIAGGVPTVVAGIAIAYTGFSGLAMAINMSAGSLLLGWMFALGIFMWRGSRDSR